jgi:hypothetical protein
VILPLLLMAQITPPPDVTSPYAWFLVLTLGALAYLGKRILDSQDKQIAARTEERDKAIASLDANTTALERAVGVVEAQGLLATQSIGRNYDAIIALNAEVRRLGDERPTQPPARRP